MTKTSLLPSDPRSELALHPCCAACGSVNVVSDAWASWDPEGQRWTLDAVFDRAQCQHCGSSTTLDWAPMDHGAEFGDLAG